MRRDPFVRYRPGGAIGKSTACIILRDLLQTRLVLRAGIWRGRRVLLDERVAPHDEREPVCGEISTMNPVVEISGMGRVNRASEMRELVLGRNCLRTGWQIAILPMCKCCDATALAKEKSLRKGCLESDPRTTCLLLIEFRKSSQPKCLGQDVDLHKCQ